VGENLDFVSVHFYPEKDQVDKALVALAVYEVGKPLVIEELSPLYCGIEQFDVFVNRSRATADGYVGFYWGQTIAEYRRRDDDIAGSIMAEWLEYFRTKTPEMIGRPNTERAEPRPTQNADRDSG
jgi:hypothetical protein